MKLNSTLGALLNDPYEFYDWAQGAGVALVVLIATVNSGMLEALGSTPARIEDLAAVVGIPTDKLSRLVNFLAAHGVITLREDGLVERNRATDNLERVAAPLKCIGIGSMSAGTSLLPALRKGITAYEERHGMPVWEHLGANPDLAKNFAGYMEFLTLRLEHFVFSEHRFQPFDVAADIAGSHGGLLLSLLGHYPGTRGILFDLPDVIEQVGDRVRTAPGGERIELVGGSFFDAVPAADLAILKQVLHDWSDEKCVAILANVRKSIAPGGRLAVIDFLLPEKPEPRQSLNFDIAMMLWASGRERTLSEFEALFKASGFKLDHIAENPRGQSIVEAVPV